MSEILEVARERVHFTFTIVDEWPPVAGETLWATVLSEDTYLVDNIPFFAQGIALNDTIEARPGQDGIIEFVRKVSSGGHSTLRFIAHENEHPMMKENLAELGCGIESGAFTSHFTVDVPPTANLRAVLNLSKRWLAEGVAEYETACLQVVASA
jgi:Domain of unknown function (DUF4265)